MITISDVLVLILFFYLPLMLLIHWAGLKKVEALPFEKEDDPEGPLVSVIIPAKDEEKAIVATLESLTKQHYKNLEIIVVNDRSTDNTAAKIEQFMEEIDEEMRQKINVLHIDALPSGWLGKNYALYRGYSLAKGDYILFTDADILFSTWTIGSAVNDFQKQQLDHLTLMPFITARHFWLRGFNHLFAFSLYLSKWPWKSNDDRQTKEGTGVGAFNLLSRKAYEKIGTHKKIAVRPDDDLQLGLLVKKNSLKQRLLVGKNHLQVEWYEDFSAMLKGLEKNIFAGLHYSLTMFICVIFAMILFYIGPFIGVWALDGWRAVVCGLSIIPMWLIYLLYTKKLFQDSGLDVLLFPVLVLL